MMRKKNNVKKVVKKIKKTEDLKINKRKNQSEPDLWKEMRSSWKEIRANLKPLKKAYNKFQWKRKIAKEKEERIRLKEQEEQRLSEEEALRLKEQEERRIKREKKRKEEKERKLKAQEEQRLEEKKIRDDRDEQIRQEQIYRERLIKGEEVRIAQLKKVHESREEERKLREERNLKISNELVKAQRSKEKEHELIEKEHKLKVKEQRLKKDEQRLKKEEQRLKEEDKINLKKVSRSEDEQKKKRLNGTVLWFNDTRGYGFIKREDKENDIFVHFSAVQNSGLTNLKKDEHLTFEVENGDKGPSAVNLQKTVNEFAPTHLKVVK